MKETAWLQILLMAFLMLYFGYQDSLHHTLMVTETRFPIGEQPCLHPSRLNEENGHSKQLSSEAAHETTQLFLSLDELTNTNETASCPRHTLMITNNQMHRVLNQSLYQIPLVVHQTYKTPCVTREFYKLSLNWRNQLGLPYYFHTDTAVERLVLNPGSAMLRLVPHLPMVWRHCIEKPVVKSDLWRLILLYEYGGIYADLDTRPNAFNPFMHVQPEDDFFTLTDSEGLPSFHFMATRPKHPLIYLMLQEAVKSLLELSDTSRYNPAVLTGPGAMKRALKLFLQTNHSKPDSMNQQQDYIQYNGSYTFHGVNGYTLRREGTMELRNQIVVSNAVKDKERKFGEMGNLSHYSATIWTRSYKSCFQSILAGESQPS
jgi:mannosyltransferase OCH1-like enzyme